MEIKNGLTTITDSNDEKRELVHRISNESVDSYNDVLISKGMDESRWRAVLYQHNYGEKSFFSDSVQLPSELIPAKKLWFSTEKKEVLMKCEYVNSTLGNELYSFYKNGFMSGLSVGWMPKGNHVFNEETKTKTFKEWYIYEASHVLFPANFETGTVEEKKYFDDLELMKKESKDAVLKQIIYKEYDYAKIKIDLKTSLDDNKSLKEIVTALQSKETNTEEITSLKNELLEIKNSIAKKSIENVVKLNPRTKYEYLEILNGAFSEFTGRKH